MRGMNFRTVIDFPRHPGYMDHRQHILLLGSCFVENIGKWLQQRKFDVDINPFGTLYNPLSIAQSWARIVDGTPLSPNDLFCDHGLWHSYYHHSRFSGSDPERVLSDMNQRIATAHSRLPETNRIVFTWGSAFVYRLKTTGEIVANCHKQPATHFIRELLTVDEIVAQWRGIVQQIEKQLPQCRLLFTVSPIRHLSDGAHGNQISKATLLLAIEQLQREFEICDYFPSYEIMMDDLRDYRFYDTDMAHPSTAAITYISEILTEAYLSDESRQIASQWLKIATALAHRPLNPQQTEYAVFLKNTLQKIMQFQQAYPYINVSDEIDELTTRINQL